MKKAIKKVKLKFKVDPEYLKMYTTVPNPVRIVIIDPESIFLDGILGQSGRKMVLAGFPFIFERKLAENLIKKKIAKRIP